MSNNKKEIPVEYTLNKPEKMITLPPPYEDIAQEMIIEYRGEEFEVVKKYERVVTEK